MLMLEIPDETRAVFREARDAYVRVMKNRVTEGQTEAERRFSQAEILEHASQAAWEALGKLTFEQISALAGDKQ